MSEFFFEILTEEMPARMQVLAELSLKADFYKYAIEQNLLTHDAEVYSTPRRLILISNMEENLVVKETEIKGPKVNAPQAAQDGFLKKHGLKDFSEFTERDGVWYRSVYSVAGKAIDALPAVTQKLVENFSWPKSMRWGSGTERWVRPLHQIMAYFDGQPMDGFAADTVGHRFLSKGRVTPKNFADYRQQLKDNFVLIDRKEREAIIRDGAINIATQKNLVATLHDHLVEEIVGLVEYPVVLCGEFEKDFLSVPQDALRTTMINNQKYIPLYNRDGTSPDAWNGTISNLFIIVSNMQANDGGQQIIAGNERVLRARLSDAKFFWEQDLKTKLANRVDALKTVTFHDKIGTMYDKVERIIVLSRQIAPLVGADENLAARAALLAKADLTSGMVGEFPELQGIMGRRYALQDDEDAKVAEAVSYHYMPVGSTGNGCLPEEPVSIAVALADRIDSLREFFRINEKPTGSRDPYALRRAAIGIIRIVLGNNLKIDLRAFFDDELMLFIKDRLKVILKEQGLRHDVIESVLKDVKGGDVQDMVNRVKAVQDFTTGETGQALLGGYRRAVNILSIEEKKDKKAYAGDVDQTKLAANEEVVLYDTIMNAAMALNGKLSANDFNGAMENLANLQQPVNLFFENILVNHEDATVRLNRLQLLASLRNTMNKIADFSQIQD